VLWATPGWQGAGHHARHAGGFQKRAAFHMFSS
jgi:hypothetical protein